MKNRLSLFFALVMILALLLTSCSILPDRNDDGKDDDTLADDGENGKNENAEGKVVFSPDVSVTLIKTQETSDDFAYTDLVSAIYARTNQFAVIDSDASSVSGNEIVIGDTSRKITSTAKEKLEEAMDKEIRHREDNGQDTKYLAGYAIYAEGGSVAIVWNSDQAISLASDFFIENFVTAPILKLEDGYFCSRTFSLLELYRADEDATREARYDEIAMIYGEDVAQAIRNHLSMFGDTYYLWLADLYDPGLQDEEGNWLGGGFYFSNSGRDTAGFGIDLESTMQTINFLTNSGMSTGQRQTADTFPQDVLDQLAAFALSCQSSVDGYFYHPQWGTNISVSRLGRDLGWATQILSFCGVKPYWNTPNNVIGLYGEPPGYEDAIPGVDPAAPMTAPLSASTESRVAAVSKVIPTAGTRKWNGSEWLSTLDKWEEYILSFESTIRTNSYSNGNTFAAQAAQISSRDALAIENGEFPDVRNVDGQPCTHKIIENGKEKEVPGDGIADGGYIEMWKYYFDKWQLDYNGLWEHNKVLVGYEYDKNGAVSKHITEDDPNGYTYYNAINGLMKIGSVYNSLGVKLNNADKAFASAAYMSMYLESDYEGEINNWKDVKGKTPNGSVDVYNPFVAMSGIISNVKKHGTIAEVDALQAQLKVNALKIVQTTTAKVAKFKKDDGSYGYNWGSVGATSQGAPVAVAGTMEGDVNGGNIAFTGVYGNMCSALGINAPKPFGYSDLLIFTDKISNQQAVIKDSADLIVIEPVTFDDEPLENDAPEDVTLTMAGGSAMIVEDPRDIGKVLRFTSSGSDGDNGATMRLNAGNVKNANCNILEWEMCFTEINYYGLVFQIKLGSSTTSYMVTLTTTKDGKLVLKDSSGTTGTTNSTDFGISLDPYGWNSFRIEYYLIDSSSAIAKIFVNGQLLGISTNHYNSHTGAEPTIKYDAVNFYALYSADLTCLFDNLYATQEVKEYVEEEIINPNKIKNFDNVTAGGITLPKGVTTTGGTVVSAPTEENPANNIFVLDATGDTVSVEATTPVPTSNAAAVSTKMKIDASTDGNIGKVYLALDSNSNPIVAYNLATYTEGGTRYASLTEVDSTGKTGVTFKGLPTGEWFALGIEFYPYQYLNGESSIVYLGGEIIGHGTLFYSLNTIAKTYTRFIVELTSDVTVSLDDITPERLAKTFVNSAGAAVEDPDIELPSGGKPSDTPASAAHDGRFDFEGAELGVPKVEGLKTTPNTNEYGNSLLVALDPTNAANKVLQHKANYSTSAGNTSIFTASKLSPSGANCYVFEFDILVSSFSGGNIQTSMKGKIGDTTVDMFQTNTYVSGNWIDGDGSMYINSKYKVADASGALSSEISKESVLGSVPVSGWVTVRYELYPAEGKVQIYYDGVYRGETSCVNAHNMSATLYTCNIYTTYSATCEMYYDNVTVEAIKKDYKVQAAPSLSTPAGDGWNKDGDNGGGNPVIPDVGGNTDLPADYTGFFDFESEQATTFNVPGLLSSTKDGHIFVVEGDGKTNMRSLAFGSIAGSSDVLTVIPLALSSGTKAANVFGFDIYVENASAGVLYYVALGDSYILTVSADADGKLAIGDIYSASESDLKIQTLADGITAKAWNTILVEYALVDGAPIAKVYLNGKLVAVSDNGAKSSMNSSSYKFGFNTVTVTAAEDASVSAYFDNITAKETDSFETASYTHEANHLGKTYTYSPISTVYGFEDGTRGYSSINLAGATESFKTDTVDAARKVLSYYVPTSASATAAYSTIDVTNVSQEKDEDGNLIQKYGYLVFSYDVRWENLTAPENDTMIEEYIFQTGNYWNHVRLYMTPSGTFKFTACNTGLKEGDVYKPGIPSGTYASGIKLNDGKWHNIMIVIDKRGFDSTLSIFIDGVCVTDRVPSYYSTVNADSEEVMKKVTFRQKMIGSSDYTVYLDNVVFEYAGDEFPLTRSK